MINKDVLASVLRNKRFQVGATAAVAFVAGAVAGSINTRRELEKQYYGRADREIEEIRAHYTKLHVSHLKPASPEAALREKYGDLAAGYDGAEVASDASTVDDKHESDAGLPLQEGPGGLGGRAPEAAVTHGNIWQNEQRAMEDENSDEFFLYQHSLRGPDKPYIIRQDEFYDNDPNHDQTTYEYWEGDSTLINERDENVLDVEGMVGEENLTHIGRWAQDPNILHVRNERLNLDFEIVRRFGNYGEEVAGFDELQHSDKPGVRRFRNLDE